MPSFRDWKYLVRIWKVSDDWRYVCTLFDPRAKRIWCICKLFCFESEILTWAFLPFLIIFLRYCCGIYISYRGDNFWIMQAANFYCKVYTTVLSMDMQYRNFKYEEYPHGTRTISSLSIIPQTQTATLNAQGQVRFSTIDQTICIYEQQYTSPTLQVNWSRPPDLLLSQRDIHTHHTPD